MSRKSWRNSIRSYFHQTPKEFYSDEQDLREHLERSAQQAILGENSVPEYETEKFRIRINLVTNVSLNLRDCNYQEQIIGQIKLNVREYTCVVNWE